MKKILLTIIVILVLGSCRSSRYNMPNDIYKRWGDQGKWHEQQLYKIRGINKTTHHPRWAKNYKR